MKLTIEKNDTTVIGILEGRLDTAASTQFALDMEELVENADKRTKTTAKIRKKSHNATKSDRSSYSAGKGMRNRL